MRSASPKYSDMSSSVRSRTAFFLNGSFWWLYSSTSSTWRNTSPCFNASLAAGNLSSRSYMSSMSYPRDEHIPSDVGLSEKALRFLIPSNPGYWFPHLPHPHGYSVIPPMSSDTASMSSPRGPPTGISGASTGGAGVTGTVSDSIVSTARPSTKNLISGLYGSRMSMWDSTLFSRASLNSEL